MQRTNHDHPLFLHENSSLFSSAALANLDSSRQKFIHRLTDATSEKQTARKVLPGRLQRYVLMSGDGRNRTAVQESSAGTLIHVRDRSIPCNWVAEFGRRLALCKSRSVEPFARSADPALWFMPGCRYQDDLPAGQLRPPYAGGREQRLRYRSQLFTSRLIRTGREPPTRECRILPLSKPCRPLVIKLYQAGRSEYTEAQRYVRPRVIRFRPPFRRGIFGTHRGRTFRPESSSTTSSSLAREPSSSSCEQPFRKLSIFSS